MPEQQIGLNNKLVVDNRQYEWDVYIDMERPTTIHKFEAENMTYPGLQLTSIKIWVSDRWYGPGAILEFDDHEFQVLVHGEPYYDGQYSVYTCYVADGQSSSYIPVDLLQSGKQVSRAGSAYPEYSEQGDIIVFNTGFKMRNQLTISRLTYDITGSAYSSVAALTTVNPKSGKREFLVADAQEWKALRELNLSAPYYSNVV
jgi:hypothetical protein